jgi:hypothetical protein
MSTLPVLYSNKKYWMYLNRLVFGFVLLWCWQQRKSPGTACLLAGVNYPTVQRWWVRFRDRLPAGSSVVLSGRVQIDESYFGKQRSNNDKFVDI